MLTVFKADNLLDFVISLFSPFLIRQLRLENVCSFKSSGLFLYQVRVQSRAVFVAVTEVERPGSK